MAYEPKRWALGLIPLAVLWVIGVAYQTRKVEVDLSDAAAKAIGSDLVDNLVVHVRGRDAKLYGVAFTEEMRQQAVANADAVYGVRRVSATPLSLPPEAKPYQWSATRAGGKIALAGSEPNSKVKATTAGMANAIAPIEDATVYARGASEAFPAAANYALRELALLSQGAASLSDNALTIAGLAANSADYEKAMAALKAAPVGVTIAKADITPPLAKPYVFTAVDTASGVQLSGGAPSLPSRDSIAAQASAAFPNGKVDNAVTIASGAPQGDFDRAAALGVDAISKLVNGKAVLTDSTLVITGTAAKFGVKEAVVAKQGPAGFTIDTSGIQSPAVTVDNIAEAASTLAAAGPKLDVVNCQDGLQSELKQGKVHFDTGSATISHESYLLIVKLAGVALRCDVQAIEVSGHTDNQGDEALNQQLSKARADAVVALLTTAGVPASRLTSAGYGSQQPVASNDTEDGRAKNRRIEFTVH